MLRVKSIRLSFWHKPHNKNYDENRQKAKHLRSLHKLEPAKSAESRDAQTLLICCHRYQIPKLSSILKYIFIFSIFGNKVIKTDLIWDLLSNYYKKYSQ